MPGILYLVATPIGNLQDMSFRAIETLKSVDLIACEDTRHSRNLLTHHGISNKLVSYHEHNEAKRVEEFTRLLEEGKSIAIISDAGTPAINDPGFTMVEKAHEIGASVVPIPGPVAFVNAAIVSGLRTDSLFFGGFLPSKKGDRRKRLEEVKEVPATLIFYESPHRLAKSLTDCLEVLGDRRAAIARELTKLHEETALGLLSELINQYAGLPVKGEIVLAIDRSDVKVTMREASPKNLADRVLELETGGLDHKSALKKGAKEFGLSKSEAYRTLQGLKNT